MTSSQADRDWRWLTARG